MWSNLLAAICGGAIALATPLFAAQQTATWTGGSGSWSTASSWSTGVVPNNNATDQYDVAIDGGNASASAVTINSLVTIQSLSIDAGDSLSVSGSADVIRTVNDVTLNGGLFISSGGVRIGTDASLLGSGTLTLAGANAF